MWSKSAVSYCDEAVWLSRTILILNDLRRALVGRWAVTHAQLTMFPTWVQLILSFASFMSLLNAALWTMMRICHGSSRSLKSAGGQMPTPALTCVLLLTRDIHQSQNSHPWLFVYVITMQEDRQWPSLDFNMLEHSPINTHKTPTFKFLQGDHPCCFIVKPQNHICQPQQNIIVCYCLLLLLCFAISCLLRLFNTTLQCQHDELYLTYMRLKKKSSDSNEN